jgi:tripartite-type tricarboxylate transporter receptor subunit TctC
MSFGVWVGGEKQVEMLARCGTVFEIKMGVPALSDARAAYLPVGFDRRVIFDRSAVVVCGVALGTVHFTVTVVTKNRTPLLPDLPTLTEVLPGFERDATHGLLSPAGTPRHILNKVSKDVTAVLQLPDVKKQMDSMTFERGPTTPEEYDRIIRNMIRMFGKIAVAAGLRAP